MEFNRRNLAVLRQVKRQARQEANMEIHFDSSTLREDLLKLAQTPISTELRELIAELVGSGESQVPAVVEPAQKASVPLTSRLISSQKPAARLRYRGQVVEA